MATIDKIYNLRNKFSVVALTGVTGSGCSELASLMEGSFENLKTKIRKPEELKNEGEEDSKQYQVFSRKYQRAYRLVEKKHESYKIISYKNALILETIILLAKKGVNVGDKFVTLVNGKFHPSTTHDKGYGYETLNLTVEQVNEWGLDYIIDKIGDNISKIEEDNWENSKSDWRKFIHDLFFCKEFKDFCDKFYSHLKSNDYYLKNGFVHRLANAIRSFGDPEKTLDKNTKKDADMENMFLIIGLINDIIKGANHDKKRNFVIDSLRCSLEIVYLRERYNAFYMVCMHNEKCIETIKTKVAHYNENKAETVANHIFDLGITENSPKDYEEGLFSVPDIYNCIGNSEIHIFKRNNDGNVHLDFYSTGEQWLKIQALLLHPGLFTPSSDERCMSVAFQVKFNSGCISRQVGCVITDEKFTIKSVGWNDVPVGQIPCGLTDARELCDTKKGEEDFRHYSKFEYLGSITVNENTTVRFLDEMKSTYPVDKTNEIVEEGLYTPFCFKSNYNAFKKQKDNVNTRSLHAEENTMLQISKNGGVGLNGGKMYVTASPCVLCSKKAYQIGIREIIYLDRYTDIAEEQILEAGYDQPICRGFCGIVGATYYKLYQPFMSYKDELQIRMK